MSPAVATQSAPGMLGFQPDDFHRYYPHRPFKITHPLCDREELQLDRLVELAKRLPDDQVEYYGGSVPVNQKGKTYPKNGLSIVETVRRIEECGSWMVMKNVQVDPAYGELLRTLLSDVYAQFGRDRSAYWMRDLHREKAFIFITSPNSVTPYHLDDEHNFLLQVRGSKQVSMWDPNDRTVMPETQIEHMLECWHQEGYDRHMPYQDEFQKRATVFQLNPGEGLHFPFGAPHWVKNGPAVSISFSITWRSLMSDRNGVVYYVNKRLRRFGLTPTPPERAEWRDSLKYNLFQGGRRLSGLLRGSANTRALNE